MCTHSMLAVGDIIGLVSTEGRGALLVSLLRNLLGVGGLVVVEDQFTPLGIGSLRLIYMIDR